MNPCSELMWGFQTMKGRETVLLFNALAVKNNVIDKGGSIVRVVFFVLHRTVRHLSEVLAIGLSCGVVDSRNTNRVEAV